MTSRRRRLLAALGVALMGSGAIVYVDPHPVAYLGTSGYCASCHEETAAHVGGHAETACQSCHPLPEGQTVRLLWSVVGGARAMPEHGALDRDSCEACHRADPRSAGLLERTAGHAAHSAAPALTECVRCHSSSLHGERSEEERCESCHADTLAGSGSAAERDCLRCHVFGRTSVDRATRAQASASDWGSEITGAQVHGAADCGLCHNPHSGDEVTTASIDCRSCHRAELAASVSHAPEGHQECARCHRPHGDRTELATACAVCHQAPRVRGDRRDPGVPPELRALDTIAPLLAAATDHAVPASGVTHEGKCASCHAPHSWAPDPDRCRECHEENAASVAALRANTHSCLGCHEPHSEAPGAAVCGECHRANTALAAHAPGRHRDCLSCHAPHEGRPVAAAMCGASCHVEEAAALHGGEERHRDCASCHTPHGNPLERAPVACRACHEEKFPGFAGSKHETCARCHNEHEFTPEAARARCAGCHEAPVAAGASHPGECTSCHTPHEAGRGRAANCAECHEDVHPQVRQHQDCRGCHQPHLPAASAALACGSCHTDKASVATRWPAASPHASGRCAECHMRHDESEKRDCRTCHTEQASPRHMGVHPECTGCHAPHEAPPTETAGWWGRCGTCHTDEAQAARAARPEHQRCENCHDHPGRSPAACQSCHTQIRQVGTHQAAAHATCTDCHATHGTAPPGRAACVRCHEDRRDHFPDAPRCQSCHPFAQE